MQQIWLGHSGLMWQDNSEFLVKNMSPTGPHQNNVDTQQQQKRGKKQHLNIQANKSSGHLILLLSETEYQSYFFVLLLLSGF